MGLRSCLKRLRRWFRSAPSAAAPRLRPLLEQLEARDVPVVNPNLTYLATLYQGLLARPLDPIGQGFWFGVLNSPGSSRTAVATDILRSQEYRGRELQLVYPALLGRPLDPAGLQFWGTVLETGGTYEQVKAGILGSQELFNRLNDNFNNWLNGVFQSQLGRSPTPAETGTYTTLLAQTGSRTAVALQILNSDAAHSVALNGIYEEILSRPLDPVGAGFWVPVLRGGTIDTAIAGVLGSAEYYNQLSSFLQTTNEFNVSDINQAANDFLNAGGKFSSQPPGVEQLDRFIPTNSAIRTTPVVTTAGQPAGVSQTAFSSGSGTTASTVTLPTTTGTNTPGVSNGGFVTGAGSPLLAGGISSLTGTIGNFLTTGANSNLTGGGVSTLTGTTGNFLTTGPGTTITGGGLGTITGMIGNLIATGGPGLVTGMTTPLTSGFNSFI